MDTIRNYPLPITLMMGMVHIEGQRRPEQPAEQPPGDSLMAFGCGAEKEQEW